MTAPTPPGAGSTTAVVLRRDAPPPPRPDDDPERRVQTVLRRLPRYLELHARRAARGPLPVFELDPVRQGDLASLGLDGPPVALRLDAASLATATALYRALWEPGRADEPWVERFLLHLIGCTRDAASTPFWSTALHLARADDAFAAERRGYALAGLASLAAAHESRQPGAAHAALRTATRHPLAAVRAGAAAHLLRAHDLARQSAPAATLDLLQRMAHDDPALEPRVAARMLLAGQQLPVPTEQPEAVYALHVARRTDDAPVATVWIRSAQTLAHLHAALALATGAEGHATAPYAFFVPGEFRGGRYPLASRDPPGPAPAEVCLGDVGLLAGHRFAYSADGDPAAVLELRVARVAAPPRPAPRLPCVRRHAPIPHGLGPPRELAPLVLRTHVNGTKHYDAPASLDALAPGMPLALRREPTNAHDERAIEVLTAAGAKLGYIPRVRNRVPAQLLDHGEALTTRLAACEGRPDWPYIVLDVHGTAPRLAR